VQAGEAQKKRDETFPCPFDEHDAEEVLSGDRKTGELVCFKCGTYLTESYRVDVRKRVTEAEHLMRFAGPRNSE